jgi:hypothetical protein
MESGDLAPRLPNLGIDVVEMKKSMPLPGIEPRFLCRPASEPSHCTDWAIPAPCKCYIQHLKVLYPLAWLKSVSHANLLLSQIFGKKMSLEGKQ